MTVFLLKQYRYDYTDIIAVYTKEAMEKEKQSWLDAAKEQNLVKIGEYEKYVKDKEEKKQEFVNSDSQLLAEAKKSKENGDIHKSKALNKERKRLQKYIDEISWEISQAERKICALKILTDEEIIEAYIHQMNYNFREIGFFE